MLELNKIYNMDCMDGMKEIPDKYFELAIVDPPYGLKQNAHRAKSRTKLAETTDWGSFDKKWDEDCPPIEYYAELFRISKNQIIWGANHMMHRIRRGSPCWIVWDKVNRDSNFADCELAYTSFKSAVRQIEYMWNGMLQGESVQNGRTVRGNKKQNEKRIHPTQKPVVLYQWLLRNYAKQGDKILDTHMGSGSSIIACHDMGFEYMAFELDKDYYDAATKRINDHKAQIRMVF